MELSSDGDLESNSLKGQFGEGFTAPEGSYTIVVEMPEDVLVHVIFKSLDVMDLLRIEATCKRWYRLVTKVIVEFDLLKTVKHDQDSKLGQLLTLLEHGHEAAANPEEALVHPIHSLFRIEKLSLAAISDDTILSALTLFPNLRDLNIAFSKLTSVGLENISRLKDLTNLKLLYCGFDRTCLAKVSALKKLRGLIELQVTKDTPLGIRMALKGLPITVPQHCIPP